MTSSKGRATVAAGAPQPGWRYAQPAIVLHWLVAALVIGMVAFGWFMVANEDSPDAGTWFGLHKSFGLVVAGLMLLRVLWRLSHPPAALPEAVPQWQAWVAKINHIVLYAALIVMPLSGYVGASYSKYGVPFFGLDTPRWAAPDRDLAEFFLGIHGIAAWVLVAMVVLHVAGAINDLVRERHGVFQRMVPAAHSPVAPPSLASTDPIHELRR